MSDAERGERGRGKVDADLYELKPLSKQNSGVDIPLIGGRLSRQNSRVTSSKAMEKDVGSEAKLDDGLTSTSATPSKKLREREELAAARVDKDKRETTGETTGKEPVERKRERKERVYHDISGQFYILTVHSPVANSEDIVISEKLLKASRKVSIYMIMPFFYILFDH